MVQYATANLTESIGAFAGCQIRKAHGATIRHLGGTGASGFGAFLGEENVLFPLFLNGDEKRALDQILDGERIAWPEHLKLVLRLVLDGVLEVKFSSSWVGGSAVLAHLPERIAIAADRRYLTLIASRLLRTERSEDLADLLYSSGRWPVGPASIQASEGILQAAAGIRPPGPWQRLTGRPEWTGWRSSRRAAGNPTSRTLAKLYVSLDPLTLEERLEPIMETIFASTEAVEMKIARTVRGLHRPDSLVVYCPRPEQLPILATALLRLTIGAPASHLTFAPAIAGSRNLYWSVDPLSPEYLFYGESWRRTITRRVARVALGLHRGGEAGSLSVAAATLLRLGLDDIDVTNWTPPYASDPS